MDETRVNQVIQYALAIAGGGEFGERELGPIHLIKYVYLGDLAYSERNEGKTFTSVAWRFYHYGPWDAGVFERIEPAAEAVHAERRTFDYGGDQDGTFCGGGEKGRSGALGPVGDSVNRRDVE